MHTCDMHVGECKLSGSWNVESLVQERDDLQTQRQAAQLAQLNLDRNMPEQPKGQPGPGVKVALDARTRPPAQSAHDLDGHISDDSD